METVVRVFLMISVSVSCVVGARWLFQATERLAYEAYVPTYVEVPVLIPAWKEAAPIDATSSTSSVSL